VTSRLQETAKELDCEFLVSESTYEQVHGWVQTGKEASVAIRGRQRPLRVYEVLGEHPKGPGFDGPPPAGEGAPALAGTDPGGGPAR
jgi:hypothetical protein